MSKLGGVNAVLLYEALNNAISALRVTGTYYVKDDGALIQNDTVSMRMYERQGGSELMHTVKATIRSSYQKVNLDILTRTEYSDRRIDDAIANRAAQAVRDALVQTQS